MSIVIDKSTSCGHLDEDLHYSDSNQSRSDFKFVLLNGELMIECPYCHQWNNLTIEEN